MYCSSSNNNCCGTHFMCISFSYLKPLSLGKNLWGVFLLWFQYCTTTKSCTMVWNSCHQLQWECIYDRRMRLVGDSILLCPVFFVCIYLIWDQNYAKSYAWNIVIESFQRTKMPCKTVSYLHTGSWRSLRCQAGPDQFRELNILEDHLLWHFPRGGAIERQCFDLWNSHWETNRIKIVWWCLSWPVDRSQHAHDIHKEEHLQHVLVPPLFQFRVFGKCHWCTSWFQLLQS